VAADQVKKEILKSRVVPELKLDDKELGYVKQLKELQDEYCMQLMRHEQLEASKKGVVVQLNSAREVNRATSQVIADLEEKIKFLHQDKRGLELRQVKLEKEVETLKRKRRSTPSPPPAKSAPTPTFRIRGEKDAPAAIKRLEFSLSPSFLPPPKMSRNRSKRWDQPAPTQERKGPSPARTPDYVNGKRLQEQGIKDNPVLYASLNSFRNKRDIEEEIRMSSKTLGHGSKGSEEVFHRLTLSHQHKVIMKANAYVEVIITDSSKYRVQGDRSTMAGSSKKIVQAYLSGLTVQQVRELHSDVQAALGDVMDTNRLMSSYSIRGPEDGPNSLEGSFFHASESFPKSSPVISPKGPYRSTDDSRALHQRLAIHNRHFILIGFYYSKWLEKLRFHLDSREEERSSSSSSSDSSGSSQRSQITKAEDKTSSKHQRSTKRPKVNDDKDAPSKKPPTPERHRHGKDCLSHADRMRKQREEHLEANKITSSSAAAPRKATQKELLMKRAAILDKRADTKLGMQDKAVFQYREERQLQYWHQGHGMDEEAFNGKYDAEQFTSVQELLEEANNNNNNGHGSTEQERR
jgi:hypothetical protein